MSGRGKGGKTVFLNKLKQRKGHGIAKSPLNKPAIKRFAKKAEIAMISADLQESMQRVLDCWIDATADILIPILTDYERKKKVMPRHVAVVNKKMRQNIVGDVIQLTLANSRRSGKRGAKSKNTEAATEPEEEEASASAE